jgi:hypothetical protein
MKEEIFKDVKGYEGLYQVSNLGRVKSLKYNKERILKLIPDAYGYYRCNLCSNGKPKQFNVHILVAMAFLGHKSNGYKIVVDHIDNNEKNNRLDNLQLITHRENISKDIKGCSSKYVGVTWNKAKSKWQAQIMINGKLKYLGYFTNEIEAAEAYQLTLKNLTK